MTRSSVDTEIRNLRIENRLLYAVIVIMQVVISHTWWMS